MYRLCPGLYLMGGSGGLTPARGSWPPRKFCKTSLGRSTLTPQQPQFHFLAKPVYLCNYTPLTNLATSMPAIVARSVIASRNSDPPVKIWHTALAMSYLCCSHFHAHVIFLINFPSASIKLLNLIICNSNNRSAIHHMHKPYMLHQLKDTGWRSRKHSLVWRSVWWPPDSEEVCGGFIGLMFFSVHKSSTGYNGQTPSERGAVDVNVLTVYQLVQRRK